MNFGKLPTFNYGTTDYIFSHRDVVYDASESHYGLTLSVPENKKVCVNGKWRIFHQLSFGEQCKFYKTFLDLNKVVYKISFERHDGTTIRYHAHCLVYFGCDDYLGYLEQQYAKYINVKMISQLKGIFYYERLSNETSVMNWINYMFKEHPLHVHQITENEHIFNENFDKTLSFLFKSNQYQIDINPDIDYGIYS